MARDREERRRQILEAALEEFSEAGYHATKVSDIVSRAGIAQGTFYLYFKDKRSIFEELLDTFFQKISDALIRIDVERPLLEQVLENVHNVLSTLVEERRFTKILLLDAVGLEAALDHKLSGFWKDLTARIASPLKEGQEMGIVRDGDVNLIAIMIVGAIKELTLQRVLPESAPDLSAIEQSILDYNLFGILKLHR